MMLKLIRGNKLYNIVLENITLENFKERYFEEIEEAQTECNTVNLDFEHYVDTTTCDFRTPELQKEWTEKSDEIFNKDFIGNFNKFNTRDLVITIEIK